MTNRQHILSTARRLAIDAGTIPSLDAIASAAGVSKGGLMHHFRSRSALLAGLAEQAIATIDNALAAAVPEGRVVETWLRISLCRDEADLYRALLTTFSGAGTTTDELLQNSVAASARWEVLLAAELWSLLTTIYNSPGFSDELVLVYLAEGLSDVALPEGFTVEHEELDMTIERVPLADAVQRVFDGDIRNAAAVIGLLAAAQARAGRPRLRPVDAE